MAFNDDITLTKGSYSVSIFTGRVSEHYKNELKVIPPVLAPARQDEAPEKATVVDLLRIIRTFVIQGWITKTDTKTAKQVKDELITIMNGARVSGGTPVTLAYDGDSINVYIKDLVILKTPNDNAAGSGNYSGTDSAEYAITLTLNEGDSV